MKAILSLVIISIGLSGGVFGCSESTGEHEDEHLRAFAALDAGKNSSEIVSDRKSNARRIREQQLVSRMMADCPMALDGVDVLSYSTNHTVSLIFTTVSGNAVELQRRLCVVAERYDGQEGRKEMIWRHAGRMRHGNHRHGRTGRIRRARILSMLDPMPLVTALVVYVDGGAKVVLIPRHRSQLELLRKHIDEHFSHLVAGECWMKQSPRLEFPLIHQLVPLRGPF